jgi:hypothetical protein
VDTGREIGQERKSFGILTTYKRLMQHEVMKHREMGQEEQTMNRGQGGGRLE